MKKVGILTLGLKDNYGGILQTVALYHFLEMNGFDPILIRKYPIQAYWKKLATKILEILPAQNYKNIRLSNIKYKNNLNFFKENLPKQSDIFYFKSDIENYIIKEKIDSIIVGSDQVWRYIYINDTEYDTYFLNLNIPYKLDKISYAASFGLSHWEEPNKINEVAEYLKEFKAVSVREKSGIEICERDFNFYNAKLVLDPTLLVNSNIYNKFINDDVKDAEGCVTYILDDNQFKKDLVNKICGKYKISNNVKLKSSSKLYSIQDWITYIAKSKFVVTDSFHGMVFSIIFNKEFLVVVNEERGIDRFYSLCNQLGLTQRLIKSNLDLDLDLDLDSINYSLVNSKLNNLKKESFDFLISALND